MAEMNIVQRYDCTAFELWVILRDPRFQDDLAELAEIDREFLKDDPVPGGRDVQVKVTLRKELPRAVANATGEERFYWTQRMRTFDTETRLDWSIVPGLIPERVTARGTMTITNRGPGRCERLVKGSIRVGIPVVGKKIEKQIVADLEKSYARAADLIRKRLAARA